MSEQTAGEAVPEWDRADRLRKSLRVAGMSPGRMADHLGVGGNTVSTWLGGRYYPSAPALKMWALRTGVPYTWLCHGDLEPCGHPRRTRKADCLWAA